ncbi:MAG: hypothetical protein ABH869_06830 [Candidatus Omnitrophota bacterium]
MKTYRLIPILIISILLFNCAQTPETLARTATTLKEYPDKKNKYIKSKYGFKTLLALNKSRKKMSEKFRIENKNYKRIKQDYKNGSLKKNLSTFEIKKKYGAPVITLLENDQKTIKWIYKPSKDTYSSGEKIYLFFDPQKRLAEWSFISN